MNPMENRKRIFIPQGLVDDIKKSARESWVKKSKEEKMTNNELIKIKVKDISDEFEKLYNHFDKFNIKMQEFTSFMAEISKDSHTSDLKDDELMTRVFTMLMVHDQYNLLSEIMSYKALMKYSDNIPEFYKDCDTTPEEVKNYVAGDTMKKVISRVIRDSEDISIEGILNKLSENGINAMAMDMNEFMNQIMEDREEE